MDTILLCDGVDISKRVKSLKKHIEFTDKNIIGNVSSAEYTAIIDNKDGFLEEEKLKKQFTVEQNNLLYDTICAYDYPTELFNEITITFYDNIVKTNIPFSTDVGTYPKSIKSVLDEISNLIQTDVDYSLVNQSVLNKEVNTYDTNITVRSYLGWIAELSACNVMCASDGTICFFPITKERTKNIEIDRHVYEFKTASVFNCTRVLFDNGLKVIEKGTEVGNTIYLSSDNIYVSDDEGDLSVSQTQIDLVYELVNGITFTSTTGLKMRSIDDLKLGDIISYKDYFDCIALSYDIDFYNGDLAHNVMTLDGEVDSTEKEKAIVVTSTESKKKINVILDNYEQKLNVTAQEVEGQNEKIAQLELSTDEIKQSITKVEETVKSIDTTYYHADLSCTGTSITRDNSSITMSVKLLDKSDEVPTSDSVFNWKRVSSNAESDTVWNNTHKGRKSITITSSDLEASANFYCDISAPEWQGSTSAVTVVDEVKSQVPVGMLTPNLPTTQTLDENGKVTPVWGLTLIPSMTFGIFSPDIAEITTVWKRRINNEALTDLTAKEVVKDNVLTVTGDILSESVRSVTYYCYMQYEYSTCMAEKSFTLVKDGSSGSNGISIVSTATMYAVNNSNEEEPTTGWITSRPERSTGQYLWRKLRVTYSDGTTTELEAECVTGDKGNDGANAINIMLSNEAHTFVANASSQATATSITNEVNAYQGATKIATTIGTITGIPNGMSVTINNNGKTNATLTIAVTTSLTTKNGVINIPVTAGGITQTKQFSFSLSSAGANGASAKLANILSSAQVFKAPADSTVYTPSYIILTPSFQNASYSKWQYSINGGTSWVDVVSGSNGLTIGTVNSVANCLSVSSVSTLFTTSVTSIVFKLLSTTTNIYDVITIARLKDGNTGKGIKSYAITYQASTSGTTAPTDTWSSTIPTVQQGQYLWSRTITTYTDNTTSTSYSVSYIPTNGANGATGTSIVNTVQQYFLSTSKVNPTDGSWTTTPPTWSSGKYLWTRFVITYKNPASTEYTVPVCDSSWEAVNEIKVGGRNYFSNKNFDSNNECTLANYQNVGSFTQFYNLTVPMKNFVGKKVILSFDCISPNGQTAITVYNNNGNPRYLMTIQGIKSPINNSWTHQELTVTVSDTGSTRSEAPSDKIEIYCASQMGCKVKNVKFEIGNVATDWTAAPEDVQSDINNAVNNATNQINTTIKTTNERIDTLNSSVQKISETVTKTSEDLASTSSKVLSIESTVNEHKTSITKISMIENSLTGKVDKSELEVYMRFYELLGSPNLEFGASTSTTKNTISNEGSIVTVNGIAQTIINSSGLIANNITTKRINFDDNHSIYTNANKQLIIQ